MEENRAGEFFAGTSGLLVTMPKRDFPPEHTDKSRLGFYALHENSIEINSSFYKLPQAKPSADGAQKYPQTFALPLSFGKKLPIRKTCSLKRRT
jgi:uncharacterized protein YecE (DUF72 family)